MMEKIPHTIGNYILPLKCGFDIGYGISQKYRPIWVLVLVSDQNQNSGFGRTLMQTLLILRKDISNSRTKTKGLDFLY